MISQEQMGYEGVRFYCSGTTRTISKSGRKETESDGAVLRHVPVQPEIALGVQVGQHGAFSSQKHRLGRSHLMARRCRESGTEDWVRREKHMLEKRPEKCAKVPRRGIDVF